MDNNTLEFIVKMKDLASNQFAKMAQTAGKTFNDIKQRVETVGTAAQKTFSRVNTSIRSAEQGSKYFRTSLDGLKGALEDAKLYRGATRLKSEFALATSEVKKLEAEIQSMEGKANASASGGLGALLKKGLAAAGIGISLAAVSGFAKESVQAANTYETQKVSYGVLTGNKGVGNALTGELRGLKENTILGPAVYQTAQTMLGFGIAAKDVIGDVKMLGDVSMGDANKLQHLTLAFSEVQAAGKLSAKEVRQMVYQGFNPLQEISRTTGKSMEELRKQMHDGGITSAMVTDAFKSATGEGGRFNNMMGTIASTSGGKLAIFEGRVASLKIAIGERLQPAVNAVVVQLTSWVTTIKEWFEIPVATQVDGQIQKILELQTQLTSVNTSEGERVKLMKELEQINPNIVAGINAQSIEYGKLQTNINGVIGALVQKKIAENIKNDNVDTITDYNEAVKARGDLNAKSLSTLVRIDPTMAARTDLGYGEKEIAVQNNLKQIIQSGKSHIQFSNSTSTVGLGAATGGTYSNVEKDQLHELSGLIAQSNVQGKIIDALTPKYNKIQESMANATKIYQQSFGISNMVVAGQAAGGNKNKEGEETTGNGKGGKGGGGGGGGSIASGITGSGPRVININGVKFADKIEFHAHSGDEVMHKGEEKFQEMYLRILNSGASVQ